MKRRDFLELSASAAVAVMIGSFVEVGETSPVNRDTSRDYNFRNQQRMRGGCRDFRVMNDSFPGFFEREIIDNWA